MSTISMPIFVGVRPFSILSFMAYSFISVNGATGQRPNPETLIPTVLHGL